MKTDQYQTPTMEVSRMSIPDDILVLAASTTGLEDYKDTDWDWNA